MGAGDALDFKVTSPDPGTTFVPTDTTPWDTLKSCGSPTRNRLSMCNMFRRGNAHRDSKAQLRSKLRDRIRQELYDRDEEAFALCSCC